MGSAGGKGRLGARQTVSVSRTVGHLSRMCAERVLSGRCTASAAVRVRVRKAGRKAGRERARGSTGGGGRGCQ